MMKLFVSLVALALCYMNGVAADCMFKLPLNCGCSQSDFDLMFSLLEQGMKSNGRRNQEVSSREQQQGVSAPAATAEQAREDETKTANLRGAQQQQQQGQRETYQCGTCLQGCSGAYCCYLCGGRRGLGELDSSNEDSWSEQLEAHQGGQETNDGATRNLQSRSDNTQGRLISTLAKLKWDSCNPSLASDITCDIP